MIFRLPSDFEFLGNSFFTSCIEAMIRSSCKPFLVLSLKELGMVLWCLHNNIYLFLRAMSLF